MKINILCPGGVAKAADSLPWVTVTKTGMPELQAALPGVHNPYEIFASGHPSPNNNGNEIEQR